MKPGTVQNGTPTAYTPVTRANSTVFVETMGLEPTTSCLQSRRSSRLSYVPLLETEDNAPEQTGSNPFEPWGCNQQASYKAN